jgi:hypothetical protein
MVHVVIEAEGLDEDMWVAEARAPRETSSPDCRASALQSGFGRALRAGFSFTSSV